MWEIMERSCRISVETPKAFRIENRIENENVQTVQNLYKNYSISSR
jgi:hypothetical protein